MSQPQPTPRQSDPAGFAVTRWTLVLTAGRGDLSPQAAQAIGELCHVYWYPLYAYIRRCGFDTHQSEDLTQEFFLRLLAKNSLAAVDQRKGRFRAFLLAAAKHFLANERDRARAQKRGGQHAILSLDRLSAESRYCLEPVDHLTPERLFERQWAITLLERVLARLQAESAALEEHDTAFDRLKPFLTGGRQPGGYAKVASDLGMTEGAVKVAVHRLRRRYRQLLREEIAQTVAEPAEIDEEIRYLLSCL
jgi:DNA-directed RNA polymerase specialized sigma24 family protein